MNQLTRLIVDTMADLKARNVQTFDVRALTTMTDYIIIASGSSDRQVKAIADRVVGAAKARQVRPLGVEGRQQAEWILIDFGDVIAHVMLPETREYYQLEKLWSVYERAGTRP